MNPTEHDENTNNNETPEKLFKKEKGKSCKGTLYYSSALQSKAKNPRCIGIPRSLPEVPRSIVKDEAKLEDFYYACAGYSIYLDQSGKESSGDNQTPGKLPVCVGLEFMVGRKVTTSAPAATPADLPAHALNKEDSREVRQPHRPKPIQPAGNDFLTRFSRNADLVASGVWKNMGKVGNYVKASVHDILYPYRGRPK